MIFIGKIHFLKIKPNTEEESKFTNALNDVGVKISSVICKRGVIFNTPYDEYLLSDGLYKLIQSKIVANGES